ncbi:hypothetical protein KP509_21G079300 [Ceratopteris richardii]|uniref:PH domain-containing protein n=1 Tax=Ceratopteris richardii TaxID=49495 RepID=A0A8T2SEW8_CERRI|nr:hypothetical protein KP509_21G079300 [Ceratopteris richardii]
MLEEHVAFYLQKYLGNYVKGLSKEALKISAWQGNVELTNMQLKPEALNSLKLPIKVKAGFLGSVKLKVPWSKLGKEPVIVLLDRIFILAEPQTNVEPRDDKTVQEEKSCKIQEKEMMILESKLGGSAKVENNSWLGSLISTIIGNLKLSITNIHIRYEDSESHPGHPFAIGLTLKKLAAHTVDENGEETFISSGPLDRIQKAGELQGLALYLDSDVKLWKPGKPWESLSQEDWNKLFEPGIKAQSNDLAAEKHQYLLQPVGASARYSKLGSGDSRTADRELQKAVLRLDDVTLSCSQAQYSDVLKMGENFSTLKKRMQYSQYRPSDSVMDNPKSWWYYTYKVISEQHKKASGRMSWDRIVHFTRLRKKYLSLYINCLQANTSSESCNGDKEIHELEKDLDIDVAVQWRILAHSYVDKSKKDQSSRKQEKGGWFSFLWSNQSDGDSNEPRKFSEEDWKQLNEFIGYEERTELSILPGQDPPDMLHTVLEIHMQHNATKLVDKDSCNIIELAAENLLCNAKFYGEMKQFNFKLGSYRLTSPEGLLAESESLHKAIGGEFILKPLNEDVDWSLSAKASPCYITYQKASFDEVLEFFQNSDAVSQTIALETAAALEATFGEVARSAQQQLNEALKQKPHFTLYLDIAAPKVIIPSEFYPDGNQQTKLLLDLGHFTLQTEEPRETESQEEQDLYMHFKLALTDVQIFLLDGEFIWRKHYDICDGSPGKLNIKTIKSFLSLLDKCGMTVVLQQICIPHPAYPSTRAAVHLPSLGFHFSPARYHRLMQVINTFQSHRPKEENAFRPWDPADFEGEVSVLEWKGIGNREAVWHRSYAALAGPFLYILDTPLANTVKRRVGFNSKQVFVIPPEFIGGVSNVLAVCDAGQLNNKVAESANTLLLRFDNEELRELWQQRLQAVVYRSSVPATVSEIMDSTAEQREKFVPNEKDTSKVIEKEKFFLIGALDELKVVISSGAIMGRKKTREQVLLGEEIPLLELRALGSRVEFVMGEYDMLVGAALQALEIQDKFSASENCDVRYLACSGLEVSEKSENKGTSGSMYARQANNRSKRGVKKSREKFFDTKDFLGEEEERVARLNRHSSSKGSDYYDAEDIDLMDNPHTKDPPNFKRIPGLLPNLKCLAQEDVPKYTEQDKFVKAEVVLFALDSPYYSNVDKQITVSLATLSFFCVRPTIMAMLDFANAITEEIGSSPQNNSSGDERSDGGEMKVAFDRKDSVVKGLLGSGKERTMFSLVLVMQKAVVNLNNEAGEQIATLAQNDLSCKIKVFPLSFSIFASLGNLRISDGSVQADHPYSFICDTRSPGSSSFIELEFSSFNKDDTDYEGYEYSLNGKLSEIRFIYLNRFIKEISSYFMGLTPQDPGYVVKIDNKVTDVEKLFTQSEVEGSPAIKLDLSLTKPILIMPRETKSKDFLELDVLHIKIINSIKWIGGGQDNPGAVRLDTTELHVEDIHLSIGINGEAGEGLIKKASGLSLRVTRSLRDLWHQVPEVDAFIKIEELKADLSDKEYQVITECAVSNLAEEANVLPPVSLLNAQGSSDEEIEEKEVEIRHTENQEMEISSSSQTPDGGPWITLIVTADISLVELSLFKGSTRDQALATAQVAGFWVAYKTNSQQESFVMASLRSLIVKDDREGTEPALQHMIGKADESEYSLENYSYGNDDNFRTDIGSSPQTMLVMDAKLSATSQMVSLRVQQPKLLVAVDFLLAITEFFVPSPHSVTSESDDFDEDLLSFEGGRYLDEPEFIQMEQEFVLSPKRPLVADCSLVKNYIYDGKGNVLRLQMEKTSDLNGSPSQPLIFIGKGKHLRFKNISIQNAELLDYCVYLGTDSSFSVLELDNVYLESILENKPKESLYRGKQAGGKESSKGNEGLGTEMVFDLQAVGPELTFYDSISNQMIPQVKERLLRAKLDVYSRFVLKSGDMELNAKINRLSLEASTGFNVIEPVNAEVKYSLISGKQDFHITVSDIIANFSFSVLQLIFRLQEDISSFLRITTKQVTVQCYQFDKIWTDESNLSGQRLTFWRARAPPGFAVLGDCVTPSDEPLAKGVLALNLSLAWFKRPIKFELVWESRKDGAQEECSIWMPVAPKGYIAFGCVVVQGRQPPLLSSVVCIVERRVTSSYWKDCIIYGSPEIERSKESGAFWRVDNSVGSFYVKSKNYSTDFYKPFELSHVASSSLGPIKSQSDDYDVGHAGALSEDILHRNCTVNSAEQSQVPVTVFSSIGELYETVTVFKLIWWNKGNTNSHLSIWRPVLPSGCYIAGDLAVKGYEPPSTALVLRHQQDTRALKKPTNFFLAAHLRRYGTQKELYLWQPLAPAGYSALGYIATASGKVDADLAASFTCIRNDFVAQTKYHGILWSNERSRHSDEVFSLWSVENEMGTFVAGKGLKCPSTRQALCLAELQKESEPDNLVVAAELKTLSAVIYDDLRGMMIPLVNVRLSGINVSSCGRVDLLRSTLNFSLTAMTYNGKCHAWEPLIETSDGVLRHRNKNLGNGTSNLLRIVSTNTFNVNISVTNLNTILEAYANWNTLSKFIERSKTDIKVGRLTSNEEKQPALEIRQIKTFKMTHHNKLGEDLLVRCADVNNQIKTVLLLSGCSASMQLAISRSFLDPSLKVNISRLSVWVMKIFLGSAELPATANYADKKYMSTVYVMPQLHAEDSYHLDQQSARTRSLNPRMCADPHYCVVEWNEAFAFEMGSEGCTVKIIVTELSTGVAVGYCLFSMEGNSNKTTEQKGDSQSVCVFTMRSETLKLPQEREGKVQGDSNGRIYYSAYTFPNDNAGNENTEGNAAMKLRPGTVQVCYKDTECWQEIGLNYAADVNFCHLDHDTIATETIINDMHKEITYRSLVIVKNSTDFVMDVALSDDKGDGDIKHAEVFENERYEPLLGWGSTCPGHLMPTDPKRWSKDDYTWSSQDFPGAQLPTGLQRTENWIIDKTNLTDKDGWLYASDFSSHDWSGASNEGAPDKAVRRRRWIWHGATQNMFLGSLHPQEVVPLPISTLRGGNKNYGLRVRPQEAGLGSQSGDLFEWSSVFLCKSNLETKHKKNRIAELTLSSLNETEVLVNCSRMAGSSNKNMKRFWFILDIRAKDRGINPQVNPLKDWQIEIVPPLMLENFLPVRSEYIVQEKSPTNKFLVREKGVIEPGENAHLYNVDIRQGLYLTWIPQGGWQADNIPVLISHPTKEAARRIVLKHFSSERYLNILVDHSSNAKNIIAKRIKFYVPLWIDVKKLPAIQCNFTEFKEKDKQNMHPDTKTTPNLKILEIVHLEEIDSPLTMLSSSNLEQLGISVALAETENLCFAAPTPLYPLSQADGSVELRAFDGKGLRYMKILASTKLCPYEGIATKILVLRPYITFTNRLGEVLLLKQTISDELMELHPSAWRMSFLLSVTDGPESLQLKLHDTQWSFPFSIKQQGTSYLAIRKNSTRRYIRVEVRGYEEGSRFLVIFRHGIGSAPYRLENRMQKVEIQYRQKGLHNEDWQMLQPCSATLYAWDDLEGEQILEVVMGAGSIAEYKTYDINECRTDLHQQNNGSSFFCEVAEMGSFKLVRFCEFRTRGLIGQSGAGRSSASEHDMLVRAGCSADHHGSSFSDIEVQLELGQFGISIIDSKLKELLYLYMENMSVVYATGYEGNSRRLKLYVGYLQLDNQLPFSVLPVIIVPEDARESRDSVLKVSISVLDQASDAVEVYPHIGIKVTKSAWRVNIHEPIIWELLSFYNELHLDKLHGESDVGQVDPEMRFDLIDISDVRLKLTIETAPRNRPKGLLGVWSPLVTALGNTSKMPIHLREVRQTNRYVRKSVIMNSIINRLKRDLIHNPLMLLTGVDVLGMTSSTLATLSETVAELSNDGKFMQLRDKLDRSRRIDGVGDGLKQATEAFLHSFGYAISGVVQKPLERGREKGFLGFIQGLGKAVLGVVVEPVSGALDFVSLTVDGVGASCTKCFELFERKSTFQRVRLPRFISSTGILSCYDEKSAEGQYILLLAEGKGHFPQGIFFREHSKFAWSDVYVDHFKVINNKIVMLTNERVMLLQCPKSQTNAGLFRDPCFILWDVPWKHLLALELASSGIEETPTYVVLHLCNLTSFARLIKCSSSNSNDEIHYAQTLLESIADSWRLYRPPRGYEEVSTSFQYRPSASQLESSASENTTDVHYQREVINFKQIWSSEKVSSKDDEDVTIWRPIIPQGYVSAGDIAHIGKHPPLVSIAYQKKDDAFKHPVGFDLIWRSWKEGYVHPLSLWMPKAPNGYHALGCVAMAAHVEPDVNEVWCAHSSIIEDARFEVQEIWRSPRGSAWTCYLHPIACDALTFMAVRQKQQIARIQPKKVVFR